MNAFVRQLALTFALLAVFAFAWMVREVIGPVLIAAMFAIVLAPLLERLKKKLGKRAAWATPLVTVGALAVIVGPIALVTFFTVRSLLQIKTSGLGHVMDTLLNSVIDTVQRFGRFLQPLGVDMSDKGLHDSINEGVQSALQMLAEAGGQLAGATPAIIVSVALFVIALFFWLRDGSLMLGWLNEIMPFAQTEITRLYKNVNAAVRGVMLGQLLTGVVQSGLTMIFLFALSVPGAFLWGVLAFFLSFVPLIGTTPVTIGACIFLFAKGNIISGIIMAVGVFVIGGADNVARPFAASSSGGMHPLLTLIAIFGGLAALGASGVFLGPVLAAIAVWSLEYLGRVKEQ